MLGLLHGLDDVDMHQTFFDACCSYIEGFLERDGLEVFKLIFKAFSLRFQPREEAPHSISSSSLAKDKHDKHGIKVVVRVRPFSKVEEGKT